MACVAESQHADSRSPETRRAGWLRETWWSARWQVLKVSDLSGTVVVIIGSGL
jgi:hypothetical protein